MKCRYCKNNTLREEDGEQFNWCDVVLDNLDIDKDRVCGCYRPATNRDVLRAMTNEELAEFLNADTISPWCSIVSVCQMLEHDPVDCSPCIMKWLKQEASDDEC